MRHCMEFSPLDTWFLVPNDEFYERRINIGFCPVCGKPVAELKQFTKSGKCHFETFSGSKANALCAKYEEELAFKGSQIVMAKLRHKVYGWIYGVNKLNEITGMVEQFASDFYGNVELVKKIKGEK